MKRILTFSIITALTALCSSADTIVFKNGQTLEVNNVEESGKWILYTVGPEADAELKRVAAAEVFAIKPAGGEMVMIGQTGQKAATTQEQSAAQNAPKMLEAVPADDNAERINAYNTADLRLKKPKKEKDQQKYCSDFIAIWGIGAESVLSDKNVEISFEPASINQFGFLVFSYYKVKVTNKTGAPIYIDLANSFRINNSGVAEPYFTNSVYTEGSTRGGGAGVNLGAVTGALGIGGAVGTLASGVNVGGGASKTATITSEEKRVLMIPPKSSVYMPSVRFSDGSKILDQYECLYFRTTGISTNPMLAENDLRRRDSSKPFVNAVEKEGVDNPMWNRDTMAAPLGWKRTFAESETPKKITRLIAYSTTPDFASYTTLPVSLFIREVMGASRLGGVVCGFDDKEMECSDESHLLFGIGHVDKK